MPISDGQAGWRYLVFIGADYYPRGGFLDFCRPASTKDQATAMARCGLASFSVKHDAISGCWAHVVDLETRAIIWAATSPGRWVEGYFSLDDVVEAEPSELSEMQFGGNR